MDDRRQFDELRASRTRIVEAGDEARRRIERNLHDGAQQRLVTLALTLATLRATEPLPPAASELLEEAEDELGAAIEELRELASGIHPVILSQEGLRAALESLAERSSLPVQVHAPDARYSPTVEETAYYLAAEALTNAAKHAHATQATVTVTNGPGVLTVEIADDGQGGANAGDGSGLTGLQDRVAALGGTLTITSRPGHGTHLRAEIPNSQC